MSATRLRNLPDNHPFFFPGLDEDQRLLRSRGLVLVAYMLSDRVAEQDERTRR